MRIACLFAMVMIALSSNPLLVHRQAATPSASAPPTAVPPTSNVASPSTTPRIRLHAASKGLAALAKHPTPAVPQSAASASAQ